MTLSTALTQRFSTTTTENGGSYSVAWTRLGSSSKPPLIFIHGTPWSSRLWAPLASAFTQDYGVYLFDNPGYSESCQVQTELVGSGSSEKEGQQVIDVSLATQAEVFALLLKSWNSASPPHVVAHDFGGAVALRELLLHTGDHEMAAAEVTGLAGCNPKFWIVKSGKPHPHAKLLSWKKISPKKAEMRRGLG